MYVEGFFHSGQHLLWRPSIQLVCRRECRESEVARWSIYTKFQQEDAHWVLETWRWQWKNASSKQTSESSHIFPLCNFLPVIWTNAFTMIFSHGWHPQIRCAAPVIDVGYMITKCSSSKHHKSLQHNCRNDNAYIYFQRDRSWSNIRYCRHPKPRAKAECRDS